MRALIGVLLLLPAAAALLPSPLEERTLNEWVEATTATLSCFEACLMILCIVVSDRFVQKALSHHSWVLSLFFLQPASGGAMTVVENGAKPAYPTAAPGRHIKLFNWADFSKLKTKFTAALRAELRDVRKWPQHRDRVDMDSIFPSEPAEPALYPHISRLQFETGTELAIFGDIHGSFPSLLRDLRVMSTPAGGSFLDNKLTLAPKKVLVFNGDYTDRGVYGAEALALIMALKLKNRDSVIVNRGNHEDQIVNNNYGFATELRAKFQTEWGGESADRASLESIYQVYKDLPLATFIRVSPVSQGEQDSGPGTYIMTAHGGIDLSNTHIPFMQRRWPMLPISGTKDTWYQYQHATVRYLAQAEWVMSQPQWLRPLLWHNGNSDAERKGRWNDFASFNAKTTAKDENGQTLGLPSDVHRYSGFLWNDVLPLGPQGELLTAPERKVSLAVALNSVAPFNVDRSFALGKELACEWMANHMVTTVFRAHQHNNNLHAGASMTGLAANNGLLDMWAPARGVVNKGSLAKKDPAPRCTSSGNTIFTGLSAANFITDFYTDSYTRVQLTSITVGTWKAFHCWQPSVGSGDLMAACSSQVGGFKCDPVTTWKPEEAQQASRLSYYTSRIAYNDLHAAGPGGSAAAWAPVAAGQSKQTVSHRIEIYDINDPRVLAFKYGSRVLRAKVFKMVIDREKSAVTSNDLIDMRLLLRPEGDTLVMSPNTAKAALTAEEQYIVTKGKIFVQQVKALSGRQFNMADYRSPYPEFLTQEEASTQAVPLSAAELDALTKNENVLRAAARVEDWYRLLQLQRHRRNSLDNPSGALAYRRRAVLCRDAIAHFKDVASGETWYPRQMLGDCGDVDPNLCFCVPVQHRPSLGFNKDLVLRFAVDSKEEADQLMAALDDAYGAADRRAAAYTGNGNLRSGAKDVAKGYKPPANVVEKGDRTQETPAALKGGRQQQVLAARQ